MGKHHKHDHHDHHGHHDHHDRECTFECANKQKRGYSYSRPCEIGKSYVDYMQCTRKYPGNPCQKYFNRGECCGRVEKEDCGCGCGGKGHCGKKYRYEWEALPWKGCECGGKGRHDHKWHKKHHHKKHHHHDKHHDKHHHDKHDCGCGCGGKGHCGPRNQPVIGICTGPYPCGPSHLGNVQGYAFDRNFAANSVNAGGPHWQ